MRLADKRKDSGSGGARRKAQVSWTLTTERSLRASLREFDFGPRVAASLRRCINDAGSYIPHVYQMIPKLALDLMLRISEE